MKYRYETETNPFPNKPLILHVCSKSFENTAGKGEIARNEQFLLFPRVFYPYGKLSAIFIKLEIVVCKLFQFWKSLEFVVWENTSAMNANNSIQTCAEALLHLHLKIG